MSDDIPEVSVWKNLGTEWALVASIAVYDSLDFEPKFLDDGQWELGLPYDETALEILTDRLYTVDWRGVRTTWCLDMFKPESDDKGGRTLTVGGPGALSMLGWELAWPDPTVGLGSQPVPPPQYSGPTETVIRTIIEQNFVIRRGETLVLPASLGRGAPVKARAQFDNLRELVVKKARRGGLGVDVGLVNTTSSTRAVLQLRIWEPEDKSGQVHLSEDVGNLDSWSQNNTAPTATKTIVGGAGSGTDRVFAQSTSPAGNAAASAWGGHRVTFENGPTSYDPDELDETGQQAMDSGAATTSVALVATESEGLMAFRDYMVGDKATAQLETGLEIVDVITSIAVKVDDQNGVSITPAFGDPSADDELTSMAELINAQDRRIRQLEQRT